MSKITIRVLSAGETAGLLNRALGDSRQWSSFLADCIRDQTSFHGLTLLPVAARSDRCRRPAYWTREVIAFIRAALPFASPRPALVATQLVEIDAKTLALPWRMRQLNPVPDPTK